MKRKHYTLHQTLPDYYLEPPEEYPEWLQEVKPAEQEIPLDEEPDFEV